MGGTHTYLSLSSPGVKQTQALWLKSSSIYFTCSHLMSSCWYALSKNSWIPFSNYFPSHFLQSMHITQGFRLLHFSHNLAVEQTQWIIRPTDKSCRPAALCWPNCELPTLLTRLPQWPLILIQSCLSIILFRCFHYQLFYCSYFLT